MKNSEVFIGFALKRRVPISAENYVVINVSINVLIPADAFAARRFADVIGSVVYL